MRAYILSIVMDHQLCMLSIVDHIRDLSKRLSMQYDLPISYHDEKIYLHSQYYIPCKKPSFLLKSLFTYAPLSSPIQIASELTKRILN